MVPKGRQLIQAYGEGRFRIAGDAHQGSVLVHPERCHPWAVTAVAEITIDTLSPLLEAGDIPEILLIGCGAVFTGEPAGLRAELKGSGVVLEWMDTGAACRTFNVLLSEERSVAAALIAVE